MGMLLRRHYPQKPVETEVVNYNDLTVKELRDIAKESIINARSFATASTSSRVANSTQRAMPFS